MILLSRIVCPPVDTRDQCRTTYTVKCYRSNGRQLKKLSRKGEDNLFSCRQRSSSSQSRGRRRGKRGLYQVTQNILVDQSNIRDLVVMWGDRKEIADNWKVAWTIVWCLFVSASAAPASPPAAGAPWDPQSIPPVLQNPPQNLPQTQSGLPTENKEGLPVDCLGIWRAKIEKTIHSQVIKRVLTYLNNKWIKKIKTNP